MALFGAPTAHEDDPERAVPGEALVVLDARPDQGEGMASGDVVNTAARLQAAVPVDGILVDKSTYRATARVIELEPAEPVTAKGKTDPLPVGQVLAARSSLGVDVAQAPQSALVGGSGSWACWSIPWAGPATSRRCSWSPGRSAGDGQEPARV